MDGCTFAPTINKNSERAARMAKKDTRPATQRLYDERIHLEAKQKMRAKQKDQEKEKEYQEQCLFKPQLVGTPGGKPKQNLTRAGTPLESR